MGKVGVSQVASAEVSNVTSFAVNRVNDCCNTRRVVKITSTARVP